MRIHMCVCERICVSVCLRVWVCMFVYTELIMMYVYKDIYLMCVVRKFPFSVISQITDEEIYSRY